MKTPTSAPAALPPWNRDSTTWSDKEFAWMDLASRWWHVLREAEIDEETRTNRLLRIEIDMERLRPHVRGLPADCVHPPRVG